MWLPERASRRGLLECIVGAVAFPAAILLWRAAGRQYLDKAASMPLFWTGAALLAVFGVVVFDVARRREYPWLLAILAVALPFFDPSQMPDHGSRTRIVFGIRDLMLVAATVVFVAQSVRSGDELERRIHLSALGWSYTIAVVLLLIQAVAADVLPPLRATWVVSLLLVGWVAAWFATSLRYQQ